MSIEPAIPRDLPQEFEGLPRGYFYLFHDPLFAFAVLGRPGGRGWIEGRVVHGDLICYRCDALLDEAVIALNGHLLRRFIPMEGAAAFRELQRWGRPLASKRQVYCDCHRQR
jgi:hypothetical protein